jgi:hypothetical protein
MQSAYMLYRTRALMMLCRTFSILLKTSPSDDMTTVTRQ